MHILWKNKKNDCLPLKKRFEQKIVKIADNYHISKRSQKEQSLLIQVHNNYTNLLIIGSLLVYSSPYDRVYDEFTWRSYMNTEEALESPSTVHGNNKLPKLVCFLLKKLYLCCERPTAT